MTGTDRLRAIAGAWDEWGLGGTLADIADQIERERDAEVADSPYDAILPEDRDAVAWVREHGGLDEVRRRWKYLSYYADPVPRSCMEKRLARLQRQIDESHAALRRRNQRIAVLASEINREHNENHMEFMRRAGNFTAFADEVCKRLAPQLRHVEGCTKDVMDAALEALDRRLMPEGCEWPTVDGRKVDFKTPYQPSLGVLEAVSIYSNGACEVMSHDGIIKPVSEIHVVALAADGEPLEVGQTVWDTDAETDTPLTVVEVSSDLVRCEYTWKDGKTYRPCYPPDQLTHTKPEPPDSAERIADDIKRMAEEWCSHPSLREASEKAASSVGEATMGVALGNLSKRCRALAERERGE